MGEDQKDRGGKPGKLISRKPNEEIAVPSSDFEQKLFRKGTYKFDLQKELHKAELDSRRYQSWLREAQTSQGESSLQDFVESEKHEILWKQSFDRRIPRSWGVSWTSVRRAFTEAGELGVQLSETLVNAGVSHPHHIVVICTGTNQRLHPEQLGLILARRDILSSNSSEVVNAQRKRGMSEQELVEAERIASEMKERTKKRRASIDLPRLGSPD
jgi:hypothetical protein